MKNQDQTDQNLKVVVVDDDDADRMSIARLIHHRFCLIEASTGNQGLEYISKFEPACVLLDYRLPDVIGLELLERIVQDGFPVVMLTGQGNEELAVSALKSGAADYLVKSRIDRLRLEKTISTAVETTRLQEEVDRRLAEFEEMIAITGQNLREPIFKISKHAMSIQEYVKAQDVGKIGESSQALQESVTQLLNFSSRLNEYARSANEVMKWSRVDLKDVVDAVCGVFRIQHGDVEFRIGSLPVVYGDKELLTKMFKNIFKSSIDYKLPERTLTVAVDSRVDRDRWIVEINHDGNTMSRQSVEASHNPISYFSTAGGLGIEIATCQKIVKRHHGSMWINSDQSVGTTFFVALPVLKRRPY